MKKLWIRLAVPITLGVLSLGSAQTLQEVQQAREEARKVYPNGFFDLAPWKAAVEKAEALVAKEPGNLAALRLLAELYGETKFSIRAWNAWSDYRSKGGEWDSAARTAAAQAARQLAFYAKQRNDPAEAERWAAQAAAVEAGQ
ncbi:MULTISPECIES: hypothetical protein [unclassified Meiothermus]|uniref:hypothetical protein n=1 Tax=unclassified Meiothermus TaxID=370471 RepID=UPI000D7C5B5E|nr:MULTISPECIES: hypothetical protein [unclassified Meiothermus]PZA07974.1 hypothetical protein DNA98_06680 [Meiothermus sp. Pnk-1]RYM35341.1 hypothetical protein EWH23_11615 [Meiothermus sp. PNK-Is4]